MPSQAREQVQNGCENVLLNRTSEAKKASDEPAGCFLQFL
jgi:hypothetical protein